MAARLFNKGSVACLLVLLLLVVDQIIKIEVKTNMFLHESVRVTDWFYIYFIENEGMAFGMKFGGAVGKFLLSFFRIGLFAALCWWISTLVKKSTVPTGVIVGLTLITAGAFGNIIDSLFYGLIFGYAPFMFGRVVDMFFFPIIDTTWPAWMPFVGGNHFLFFAPVFNFADSCVTVGALYLIFFQYKFFARGDEPEEESK